MTRMVRVRGYTQMQMFQHDSATMFRFVLRGELTGGDVRELEHAWTAAQSILGTKALVVDISGMANADAAGVRLLTRMKEAGALLNVTLAQESPGFIRSIGAPGRALVRYSRARTS